MIPKDVDLYYLYIQIPTEYKEGKTVGYRSKSIGDILDNQDFFELVILERWINEQILSYINWNLEEPITSDIIEKALKVFGALDIKPKKCQYIESDNS